MTLHTPEQIRPTVRPSERHSHLHWLRRYVFDSSVSLPTNKATRRSLYIVHCRKFKHHTPASEFAVYQLIHSLAHRARKSLPRHCELIAPTNETQSAGGKSVSSPLHSRRNQVLVHQGSTGIHRNPAETASR